MCPLVSGPETGYADFQRVSNWDSPLLVQEVLSMPALGSVAIGPYSVSRYESLALSQSANPTTIVTVTWSSDSGGANTLASRVFSCLGNVGGFGQTYYIPNLGPYVSVSIFNTVNSILPVSVTAYATNRPTNRAAIPTNDVLDTQLNRTLPASGNVSPGGPFMYAGPVVLWYVGNVASAVYFKYYDPNGNAQTFWRFTAAVNVDVNQTLVVPMGSWYYQVVNNTAGAGVFSSGLTATSSGSS